MSVFAIPTRSSFFEFKTTGPDVSTSIDKDKFIVEQTYQTIVDAIKHAFQNNINLHVTISGSYTNPRKRPSLQYWEECNPSQMEAITVIMNELTNRGWHPKLKGVDNYRVDSEDGQYSHGNVLHLECDFTSVM